MGAVGAHQQQNSRSEGTRSREHVAGAVRTASNAIHLYRVVTVPQKEGSVSQRQVKKSFGRSVVL